VKEKNVALDTVDKVLDFAIRNEEHAAEFYTKLADKAGHEHMRDVFLAFAQEEKGHKAKLLAIKGGKQVSWGSEQRVLDLKIADYLEEVDPVGELDYQKALIVAMKAEKAAFRVYEGLAAATDDPALKATLLGLAQEEAKHKLRFEVEYDDKFLREL
jgi:rubrerythrin